MVVLQKCSQKIGGLFSRLVFRARTLAIPGRRPVAGACLSEQRTGSTARPATSWGVGAENSASALFSLAAALVETGIVT